MSALITLIVMVGVIKSMGSSKLLLVIVSMELVVFGLLLLLVCFSGYGQWIQSVVLYISFSVIEGVLGLLIVVNLFRSGMVSTQSSILFT